MGWLLAGCIHHPRGKPDAHRKQACVLLTSIVHSEVKMSQTSSKAIEPTVLTPAVERVVEWHRKRVASIAAQQASGAESGDAAAPVSASPKASKHRRPKAASDALRAAG
jgi:hypothetical protein